MLSKYMEKHKIRSDSKEFILVRDNYFLKKCSICLKSEREHDFAKQERS